MDKILKHNWLRVKMRSVPLAKIKWDRKAQWNNSTKDPPRFPVDLIRISIGFILRLSTDFRISVL